MNVFRHENHTSQFVGECLTDTLMLTGFVVHVPPCMCILQQCDGLFGNVNCEFDALSDEYHDST